MMIVYFSSTSTSASTGRKSAVYRQSAHKKVQVCRSARDVGGMRTWDIAESVILKVVFTRLLGVGIGKCRDNKFSLICVL